MVTSCPFGTSCEQLKKVVIFHWSPQNMWFCSRPFLPIFCKTCFAILCTIGVLLFSLRSRGFAQIRRLWRKPVQIVLGQNLRIWVSRAKWTFCDSFCWVAKLGQDVWAARPESWIQSDFWELDRQTWFHLNTDLGTTHIRGGKGNSIELVNHLRVSSLTIY